MSKVTLSRKDMSRKGNTKLAKALNLSWNTEMYSKRLRSKTRKKYHNALGELVVSIAASAKYHRMTPEAVFESISPMLCNSSLHVLREVFSYIPKSSKSKGYVYGDVILDQLILRTIDTELAFTKHEAACVQYERAVAFRKSLDQVGLLNIRGRRS